MLLFSVLTKVAMLLQVDQNVFCFNFKESCKDNSLKTCVEQNNQKTKRVYISIYVYNLWLIKNLTCL